MLSLDCPKLLMKRESGPVNIIYPFLSRISSGNFESPYLERDKVLCPLFAVRFCPQRNNEEGYHEMASVAYCH